MNYVGRLFSNVRDFYMEMNAATLTGAIDVVVLEQPDGQLLASPFHVRFGKASVLHPLEKIVDIKVNDKVVSGPSGLHMKLGESGEAFFVEEVDADELVPPDLATSPMPSAEQLMRDGVRRLRQDRMGDESSTDDRQSRASSLDSSEDAPVRRRTCEENIFNFEPPEPERQSGGTEDVKRGRRRKKSRAATISNVVLSRSRSLPGLVTGLRKSESKEQFKQRTQSQKEAGSQTEERKTSVVSRTESYVSTASELPQMFPMEDFDGVEHPELTPTASPTKDIHAQETDPDAQSCSRSLPNNLDRDDEALLGRRRLADYLHNRPFAFHPFSDTDITPGGSEKGSRSGTPTKSDPQLDKCGIEKELEWKWGEFPDRTPTQEHPPASDTEVSSGWGLSNIMSLGQFMRRTKRMRHQPESEGIYLDQLLESQHLDPELAALYMPKSRLYKQRQEPRKEQEEERVVEDAGYASSNPSSISGDHTIIDDRLGEMMGEQTVSLSLCGGLATGVCDAAFQTHLVSHEQLCENPDLFSSPDLVVKVNGRYFGWKVAAPMLISLVAFQKPLNEKAFDSLLRKEEKAEAEQMEAKLRPVPSGGLSSWLYWRRSTSLDPPTVKLEEPTVEKKESAPPATEQEQQVPAAGSTESTLPLQIETGEPEVGGKKYRKTLRLTSEQLRALCLHRGQNEARFSVTTRMQGTAFCNCNIYLWRWDDRIVISDIDGTITKSDVLGHILPVVGNQWVQAGVTNLFTRIVENGYKIIYLSSRAIGQSGLTKNYLRSVRQDDLSLPHGPLLLSPTSLMSALHREVIERNPEEFKKSCLRDIRALFPESINPFYAGYGNRINDEWAYQALGVPTSRIFSINHRGEVRHALALGFSSTYTNMSVELVDHLFPPLTRHDRWAWATPDVVSSDELRTHFTAPERFSNFTFWRSGPDQTPDIDLERFPMPNAARKKRSSIPPPETRK